MNDLKKIAAEMREQAKAGTFGTTLYEDGEWRPAGAVLRWADALDALAAQSQEPVALLTVKDDAFGIQGAHRNLIGLTEHGENLPPGEYELHAAPQPAPPQPAVPESFEKALDELVVANFHAADYIERHNARAEVLRLYALAAEAAVTWQPIETAPKDGTVILGWPIYGHAGPREIQWRAWAIVEGQEECWIVCNAAKSKQEVTHWMPLPAAPEPSK